MRRIFFIVLMSVLLLVVVAAGAVLFLINDEEYIKQRVAAWALEETGRELVISGPLDISLGRVSSISAESISFSNAEWADQPQMVKVGRLFLSINLPALLENWVYLSRVELDQCDVELLVNEDDTGNWELWPEEEDTGEESAEEEWQFAINDLVVNNCSLLYNSPERIEPVTVVIDAAALSREPGQRAEGRIAGRINGEPLSVEGWLGPMNALIDGGEIKHELRFEAGEAVFESSGSVADTLNFTGIDFSGHFQGPDIARLLRDYELPELSDGSFDFRVDLTTLDGMTLIDVDGDLGRLKVNSAGRFDSLLDPRNGHVTTKVTGPNLRLLGEAIGIDGLVPETYELDAVIDLQEGLLHFERAVVKTPQDQLDFSGNLALVAGLGSSEAKVHVQTSEAGRWWPLFGEPEKTVGPIDLVATGTVDSMGEATIEATLTHLDSMLEVNGPVGPLFGPYEPALDFVFHSENMPQLAALLGEDSFPAKPFDLSGRIIKQGDALLVENLQVFIEDHRAVFGGQVNLVNDYSGSRFNFLLDIPDAASLGQLFGIKDLPKEPFQVEGDIELANTGLTFKVADSHLSGIRLQAEGRIPDLDNLLGIDADFNIHLPSLRLVSLFLPDLELPLVPLSARGRLVNQQDRTIARDIKLEFGNVSIDFAGYINRDMDFELDVDLSGPDLEAFAAVFERELPALPFSLKTAVAGNPRTMRFSGIKGTAGESRVSGDIDLELGEVTRISGMLESPYFDLNPIIGEGKEQRTAALNETQPDRVFKDKPLTPLSDFGLDIDTRLKADTLLLGYGELTDFDIGLRLRGQSLEVKPFTLRGLTGGPLSGEFLYSQRDSIPTLQLDVRGDEQRMTLGAAEGQDPTTLPLGEFRLRLDGSGRTQHEMAASMNGMVRARFGKGEVASLGIDFLMGDFIIELFDILNPTSQAEEYTHINCTVVAADIVDGMVKIQPALVQTRQVTIISEGVVNLDSEKLDISFHSKQRKGLGISASNLVHPFIKVGGTMASPALELDPASTVVKGSIAVATAGLSILARSVADRFLSSKDPCGDAERAVQKRDSKKP